MSEKNLSTLQKNIFFCDAIATWRQKLCFLIFPISIIYMEVIIKICTTATFFNMGLLFMPLFSISVGTLFSLLCTSFSEKSNRVLARCILFILAILFSVQIVYHWCFDKYLILYSVGAGGTGQIIEEGIFETTLRTIKACAFPIILTFIPAILSCIFLGERGIVFPKIGWLPRLISAISSFALHFITVLLVLLIPASNEIYLQVFDPNLTVSYFGLLNTEFKDFKYNVLGLEDSSDIDVSSGAVSDTGSDIPTAAPTADYKEWIMDIDFASLAQNETDEELKELHEYFAKRSATMQNEYTGKYKDYNLIYITAEGFSPYAIDKELTPTLYKMYNEGYRFNNFYTPIWGVSTSDGEYVNCTGLIPKSGVWSFYRSGEQQNNMMFTMGRQFLKLGADRVYAYHNHSYSYYRRDISHPNMGYKYTGYGNGLEDKITKSWPESDLEMIAATADDYITADKQFHAYYMSVSGHLDYDFSGNAMAKKNQSAVEGMNASERVKAYMACHIELDKAMELLLEKLKAAGVAEKTLIVIAPDHYPYGLEDKESEDKYHYFSEILGHDIETNFELYKSALIMYTPSMTESVEVDKYCSSLDILPTLNNLFGMEHDSRLMMGRDIFSASEQLVVFSNRSFITQKGMYNSVTKSFTPFDGETLDDEEAYLKKYKTEVNNMFIASAAILDNDYYGIIFNTKEE